LPTALWPQFDKAIGEATSALIAAQVSPWARLQSGQPLRVQRFDGSTIAYPAGTRYAGAAQAAFWRGYMEPFLEDLALAQLRAAAAAAKDVDADPAEVVADVAGLLNAACRKVYDRMADIDKRLLGDGYADAASGRGTRGEMRAMEAYIRKQAASASALAAIAAQKPPPLRVYAWRNRVLVGLLVGLVVASVAAIVLL